MWRLAMNRRQFIKLTAAASPVMLVSNVEGVALLEALYIMAGAVITGTGLLMAWKISKCSKHHNGDDAPPSPPAPSDPPLWLPIIPGPLGMNRAPANTP